MKETLKAAEGNQSILHFYKKDKAFYEKGASITNLDQA